MLIGLTGQIGSGKSTVAKQFAALGASIIYADEVGREVVESQPVVLSHLARVFGVSILTRSGHLNRAKLAELAFANVRSTTKLNSIVHPALLRELRRRMRAKVKANNVVVVDAALLHLWKLDREVDLVILVYAPRHARIARMRARGISALDAARRTRVQVPYNKMKSRSNVIIRNVGSPTELKSRTTFVWNRYIAGMVDR